MKSTIIILTDQLPELETLVQVGVINFTISFTILCVLSFAMYRTHAFELKEPILGLVAMFLLTGSLLGLLAINHWVAVSAILGTDISAFSDLIGLKKTVSSFQDFYSYMGDRLRLQICNWTTDNFYL